MGLFDKLREVADVAKETLDKVVETAQTTIDKAMETSQNANNPLADLTVKKYFEIICGMRQTFLSGGEEPVKGNEKAKKYIEYFLGGGCEEEKLEKALELYNLSRVDIPNGNTQKIVSDFRKSLKNVETYRLDTYEAEKMFCKEKIENAKIEFTHVLDVIKDNINYKHFAQGLKKIKCSNAIKDIVITDSFCDGEIIIQKLIVAYLIDDLVTRANNDVYTSLYDFHDDVALVVLKALHFEKSGKTKDDYKTITDDDYRDFVLNVQYYKSAIDDNPFDKEKYINKYVKHIKDREVFDGTYSSYAREFHIRCIDDYFCDAVCNLVWKEISTKKVWLNSNGENISASQNLQDAFNILSFYLKNPIM